MHEMSVAQSIIDAIAEQAKKNNAKPIRALISCGQFNTLNDEAMQFAFEAISDGTPCHGVLLQIKHIPLRAKCQDCQESFVFDIYSPHCPKCKIEHFTFEPDAPLLLEEIEFEDSKEC
jgi:hydrogenase nickel incorporation protein HypA/HybF